MDEYVKDMLNRYFWKLSQVGYAKDKEVMRLLAVTIIQGVAAHDYRGFITGCDRKIIERALYNLTGGCALPYPKINHNGIMNKLHLGDISELAARVEELDEYVLAYSDNNKAKQKQQDERLDALEDKHDIEHPEYNEDDEAEYGAKIEPRDRGHVETIGCGGSHCDEHGIHHHAPEPYVYDYPFDDCGCRGGRWR